MKGQNVGYIRVSSIDQNNSRQLDGIKLDTTFEDHCSGKDTNRPQLPVNPSSPALSLASDNGHLLWPDSGPATALATSGTER